METNVGPQPKILGKGERGRKKRGKGGEDWKRIRASFRHRWLRIVIAYYGNWYYKESSLSDRGPDVPERKPSGFLLLLEVFRGEEKGEKKKRIKYLVIKTWWIKERRKEKKTMIMQLFLIRTIIKIKNEAYIFWIKLLRGSCRQWKLNWTNCLRSRSMGPIWLLLFNLTIQMTTSMSACHSCGNPQIARVGFPPKKKKISSVSFPLNFGGKI